MTSVCAPVSTGGAFLGSLLRALDCHSQRIAEQSFAFVGGSGGPGGALLLAAVTLAIAFVGYRLMFGSQPTIGEGAALAVKVGIALALVTAWPTVSRVIAGPVINGPAELSAWAAPDLEAQLVHVDGGIAAVTTWGTGRHDIRSPRTADGEFTANVAAAVPLADTLAFSGARLSYLLTAIGAVGFLGLATGVLVGLAPVFAGLLLFDRTRGVFAGWARTLFALLVAGTAVRVVLGLEAALLEPWLGELIHQRQAFLAAPSAGLELLTMTLAFALITAGVIGLVVRLCLSLELPVLRLAPNNTSGRQNESQVETRRSQVALAMQDLAPPDRAVRTAAAIERLDASRESTRILQSRLPDSISAHQSIIGAGARATGAHRSGRTTLIGKRRDRKT